MSLLDVTDLRVSFGGVAALDGVTLRVEEGELVGLIGPNGAGKTTCIDALTGYASQATGDVWFDGCNLRGRSPHERVRRGLVRTFQSVELFDDLSVRDNLRAAAERRSWWQSARDLLKPRWTHDPGVVDSALDILGLTDLAEARPSELSLGQQKLAGCARALACSPRLLLLDEPAAGLDSAESLALGDHLRAVVASGVTVVLVDHDMGLVLGTCDRIIVLDFGEVLAEGSPAEVRRDPRVLAAYLGDDVLELEGGA